MTWTSAFDGIGSEVVGALVTVAVLVATLRFERRHAARQRIVDEARRLRDEVSTLTTGVVPYGIEYQIAVYGWFVRMESFLRTVEDANEPGCFVALMRHALERLAPAAFKEEAPAGTPQQHADTQTVSAMLSAANTLLRWYAFTPKRLRMSEGECARVTGMLDNDHFYA